MDSGHKKGLDFIEDVTRRAAEVQEQVLSSILKQNAHTEYLKRHGLDGRTDKSSFKKSLPMVTYEDLQLDIERIANGDLSPILCGRPISEFLTSSGTSAGQRKLMPTISDELERKCFLYSLLMPVMNKYMPGLEKGKGMYLHFIKSESVTPGGLLARPVLTSYYKSTYYIDRPHDPFNCYTSPNETVLCPNSHESMYCQLLCGLIQRSEVLRMGAVFASGFLRALRFLQQHWMDMCEDIKVGKVAKVSDAAAREAVMRLLTAPDPVLAESIAQECSKASWQGIIKRLWPNTKYIDVIVTGTMAQYISALDYYSGGLPLVCTMYASSECYFGLNLRPLDPPSQVSYTLLPNMCYYEFLSVEHAKDDMCSKWLSEQLVELVDVKVGHEYELVVTTYSGLCRYRVGDILRVTGFHNAAPQFAFVCRKNVVLSVDSDKTGEEDLHVAVQNASRLLQVHGATLVDYTSFADTSSIPGHYVLFWEIERPQSWNMMLSCTLLEDCCLAVEEALDSVYRQGRVSDKSIGPLEIRVVARGSFDHLMDYALTSGGASINQYKTPRCVTFAPILELLNSRVTQRSFSTRCPHWSPSYHRQHKPSPLLLHHRQLSPATSPGVSPFAAMKCSNAMQV